MANTMKAAVVHAFGRPLEIEHVPVPTSGPGEVLVRIAASGVCHTDLHAADGDWPAKPALPFIPGHEGAEIVAACGAGIAAPKEGDRVGIAWLHDVCGGCEYSVTGGETLCQVQRNSGYTVDGSFAECAIGAAPYVGWLPHNSTRYSPASRRDRRRTGRHHDVTGPGRRSGAEPLPRMRPPGRSARQATNPTRRHAS